MFKPLKAYLYGIWDDFSGLIYAFLHFAQREERLREERDVVILHLFANGRGRGA